MDVVSFSAVFQTPTEEQRDTLITGIARNSLHLSQDPFGNSVVQYLIEHKVSAVKLLIQFRLHNAELTTQKFSSHVVEKCLRQYPKSRAEIIRELLSVPNFEHLLQDPYANYVIQTALSVTKGPGQFLVEKVWETTVNSLLQEYILQAQLEEETLLFTKTELF